METPTFRNEQLCSDGCIQCSTPDTNPPLTYTLSLDPTHPYLAERGLSRQVLDQFGVGYCDRGPMHGRICIPIHDAEGNLVAYAGRWANDNIPSGVPRYLLPQGFRKRHVLFNLHRIGHGDHIVLVEGYWSVFRLHSLGFPVAGLLGSGISREQTALLVARKPRFVTLLMDGDRAGRHGREKSRLC
jgi:DNA primase